MDKKEIMRRSFLEKFGYEPSVYVRSPGRVEVLGNHTDYNEGFVLSAALSKEILFTGAPRKDNVVKVFSEEYNDLLEFNIDSLVKSNTWVDYIKGVVNEILNKGYSINGFDLYIKSSLPVAAGLSSSAALEVGTSMFLEVCYGFELEGRERARMCRSAENNFVGTQCGILDQFSCIFGKKNHLIFLDCRDLSYDLIPFGEGEFSLVLCNTKVKHTLIESEYNTRHKECFEARDYFREVFNNNSLTLRDIKESDLEKHRQRLSDNIYKRAKHVIGENSRVLECVSLLKQGKLKQTSSLFFESHISSKNLFENSCKELDILVEIAKQAPGIIGARLTGGGFGGATLNIIETAYVQEFSTYIKQRYLEKTGKELEIYPCSIEDGCSVF